MERCVAVKKVKASKSAPGNQRIRLPGQENVTHLLLLGTFFGPPLDPLFSVLLSALLYPLAFSHSPPRVILYLGSNFAATDRIMRQVLTTEASPISKTLCEGGRSSRSICCSDAIFLNKRRCLGAGQARKIRYSKEGVAGRTGDSQINEIFRITFFRGGRPLKSLPPWRRAAAGRGHCRDRKNVSHERETSCECECFNGFTK